MSLENGPSTDQDYSWEEMPMPEKKTKKNQFTLIAILVLAGVFAAVYLYKTPSQKEEAERLAQLANKQAQSAMQYQEQVASQAALVNEAKSEAQAKAEQEKQDAENAAAIPKEEWYLRLVNHANPLPEDFDIEVENIDNDGRYFDARAITPLLDMIKACEAADLQPFAVSGSCSREYQQTQYGNYVRALVRGGMSQEEAETAAQKANMAPGESEHNLGLGVDIVAKNNQRMEKDYLETPEYKWLLEHAHEYGFIQRYPEDKAEITGVEFEPWHFRYVGVEQAALIRDSGLCLEEYLA